MRIDANSSKERFESFYAASTRVYLSSHQTVPSVSFPAPHFTCSCFSSLVLILFYFLNKSPCASLSTKTSCWVLLFSHEACSYGNPLSTKNQTALASASLLYLSSCLHKDKCFLWSSASVAFLNIVVFSSKDKYNEKRQSDGQRLQYIFRTHTKKVNSARANGKNRKDIDEHNLQHTFYYRSSSVIQRQTRLLILVHKC